MDAKTGFIISPIGAEGSDVRKHADIVLECIIKPALDECGVRSIRADNMDEPGRITEQLINGILNYDLCVAVLTGHNPNVFYELAVAQLALRPLVLLIAKGEVVPFDVKDYRVVEYDLEPISIFKNIWVKEVVKQVQAVLSPGFSPPRIAAAFDIPPSRQKKSGGFIVEPLNDEELQRRYRDARSIRVLNLAGTQFARLGKRANLGSLFDMSQKMLLQILLGDPKSEGVRLRYESGFGEPDTFEAGLAGIERRLISLYVLWKTSEKSHRDKIDIRVFPSYPSVSLIQIDEDYYSAIYGCQLRGGDCPIIHTTAENPYSEFLVAHFNNVQSGSSLLADWVQKYCPDKS